MFDKIVDIVIPYVDNTDRVWQKAYFSFCKTYNLPQKIADLHTDRYEDIGLINYQIRLINKYMPFVNNIFLLLMNREQTPKNLPSNVIVIYHAQFIPQKYLPTFNSCTIEMFLWNIPKLSEYFIYANDDMLPFKPLTADNFFDENGKARIDWWEEDLSRCYNIFRKQSWNCYNHITTRLGKKNVNNPMYYIRPAHSMTPMIKSHCVQAFNLIKDIAYKHIRAFRTEYQYNQYIYPLFEKFVYGTSENNIDFLYTQCKDGVDFDHDIVCVNVIPKDKEKIVIKKLEESLK